MDAEYRGMAKWNRVENLRSEKFFRKFFCAHLASIGAAHARCCAVCGSKMMFAQPLPRIA